MSEINNTPDLNEAVEMVVIDSEVITTPIDDTLEISGAAADAAAVGLALAQKADKTDTKINVNGQEADNQGLIILYAEHIPMSGGLGAPSVKEAIEAEQARTAEDIPVSGEEGAQTIAEALAGMEGTTADEIPMSAEDETTVAERIAEVAEAAEGAVRSVTAGGRTLTPDADGNVAITEVENAQQLISNKNTETTGTFIIRPTSGYGSVSDGSATLETVNGRSVHTGYVAEVLQMTVDPMPRPTPAGITATLDEETFEAYAGEAGTYTLTYTSSWSADPALYGVTVSGTPESGDSIQIVWDGENDATMTVTSPREPEEEITATLDAATFRQAVLSDADITLFYTNAWSTDPATYGITVTGTPVTGDQISVHYVKEVRGQITNAAPTALVATGWNLFNSATGAARVCRYSETYGYKIGGSWTKLEFSETESGTRSTITPTAAGLFAVSGDGWLHVTGGDATTYIYCTWSDWIAGYEGDFETYTTSGVDLSGVMQNFPFGLCRIGNTFDTIDLTRQEAISRIERMEYTEASRAAAAASGRDYDFDETWIYIVRLTPVRYTATVAASYTANEHGLEWAEGTAVPIEATALYGTNLKDKLERNVVTFDMTVGELTGA